MLMKLLLSTDRIQAYLIRDLLAMHGVRTHLFNENMQGAVGGLPVDAALPQIWLEDDCDLERARGLLARFEADRGREGEYLCGACREPNPVTFESCWNCGAAVKPG